MNDIQKIGSLCIPIYDRKTDLFDMKLKTGPNAWIEYIDEQVLNGLTVRELAEHFGYSERDFRDTFGMYYGVSPGTYIKKRRLYLVADIFMKHMNEEENCPNMYGFKSNAEFRNTFFSEFGVFPENYCGEEYRSEDLAQYYYANKERMLVRFADIPDIRVVGKKVKEGEDEGYVYNDLIESIVLRLKATGNNTIVVWVSDYERDEHVCICGSEVSAVYAAPPMYTEVEIKGGRYAVLQRHDTNDTADLLEAYRMMYRCAFSGWIKENRTKVDLDRVTFVRYQNDKLLFYIPVKKDKNVFCGNMSSLISGKSLQNRMITIKGNKG